MQDEDQKSVLPGVTPLPGASAKTSASDLAAPGTSTPFWPRYYHRDIASFLDSCIPEDSTVLHVGCRSMQYLSAVDACTDSMALSWTEDDRRRLTQENPRYGIKQFTPDLAGIDGVFDFIILSDVLGKVPDVQEFLSLLKARSTPTTRLLITNYSRLWQPILTVAVWLGCKRREPEESWLGYHDLLSVLELCGYDVVRTTRRFMCPIRVPIISGFFNRILVKFPFFRHFGLYNAVVARLAPAMRKENPSLSVIIPARNEAGNIEEAVRRMPKLGASTEIIFVEGGSTDETWAELERVQRAYEGTWKIRICRQQGKGKGDAVRLGFSMAEGDILTILDADLTVPPEELPKFYHAIAEGRVEFANGCRLIYPMERGAMRFLNLLGNHFFSLLFSWLLEQRIKDTLCGTKMLYRADYERLAKQRAYFGETDPFGDFDLIFGASRLNLKIIDIPVHYKARTYGDTNISRWRHGLLLVMMSVVAMRKLKFR